MSNKLDIVGEIQVTDTQITKFHLNKNPNKISYYIVGAACCSSNKEADT